MNSEHKRLDTAEEIARHMLREVSAAPPNYETLIPRLGSPITDTQAFFVRSRSAGPVEAAVHQSIEFMAGDARRTIDIATLVGASTQSVVTTMECAGNSRVHTRPIPQGEPWDHGAVGTAEWTGVPLRDVIGEWIDPHAFDSVVVEGWDSSDVGAPVPERFARSLPLAKALDASTILATAFNGQPLSLLRGGPVRLVVPGWYGMASVKWVRSIRAARGVFDGFFQTRRYIIERDGRVIRPVSRALVKSLMFTPCDGDAVSRASLHLRGWAWSGERAIAKVEVSTSGDSDWREASLKASASPYAWTGWTLEWTPPHAGRYVLRCRATDSAGDVQPLMSEWNAHGYENNGVQCVTLTVVE